MSLRPTTELLDLSYDGWDDWPSRPTEVECVKCNREGKWSGTSTSYLEIPCYGCAKRCGFMWVGVPCNGSVETPSEELDSETPEFGFRGEYSTHEIVMKVIDQIYHDGVNQGSFMPTDSSFTTMDNVLQYLCNSWHGWGSFEMRPDIYDYVNAVWNHWESMGSWPNIQEGDHEHEIRFFKETFQNVLPEYESSSIIGIEEDLTGARVIIGVDEEGQIIPEDKELRKKTCHDGINILEQIMEKDGKMNEENYRQLMNIFKTIHDN
jgi:hypothetical protein